MRIFLIIFFTASLVYASAQPSQQPGTSHKVLPRENWYSIGRLYAMNPKEIASYNGLTMEVVLKIGQVLKIPSTVKKQTVQSPPADSVRPKKKDVPVSVPVPAKNAEVQIQKKTNEIIKPAGEGGDFFMDVFDLQSKEGKVQQLNNPFYAFFKSSSGWHDEKYYLLLKGVLPGTIVKLKSNTTGKVVYAKVLGGVPPGKENEGLDMRMSNATVAALGIGEQTKSSIELVWYH